MQQNNKLSGMQRLFEAGLLIFCAIALYLMMALFSFDPADPGWAQTGYQTPVRNIGGAVGAYIADLSLNVFGFIAYFLPFILALLGYVLFQKYRYLLQLDFLTLGLKIIGFIMLLIGSTALASMNFDDIFYFSAGGIIGDFISNSVLPYFSFVGSTLLFLWLCCTGVVFLTGFSWLGFIDNLGAYTISAVEYCYGLPAKIKTHQQAKKARAPVKSVQVINTSEIDEPEIDDPSSLNEPTATNMLPDEHKLKANVNDSQERLVSNEGPEFNDDNQAQVDLGEHKEEDTVQEKENKLLNKAFSAIGFNKEKTVTEPEIIEPTIDSDFNIDFTQVNTNNTENEPFVAIDDLIEGPVESIQQHVNEQEVTAALEPIEKVNVIEKPSAPTSQALTPSEQLADKYQGMPSIDLLDRADKAENPVTQDELDQVSRLVEAKLMDFGIKVDVVSVFPGPVITRFELDLAPGVKVSKISNLSKDLARALSAISVRVVEVIPGKSVIGLEIPNKHREIVRLSEVIACPAFVESSSPLAMVLGADIAGAPVVVDLGKMPHLLVAGTTGSGKSVGVNTMIVSLLYKSTPEDVRMIMIDPKMLELSVYEGIPHLLSEVVTDMKDAANALRWCVGEMERRYKVMSGIGVRNLKGYNKKVLEAIAAGEPLIDPTWQPSDALDQTAPELEKLPSIVVIVDEFADMMMIVGKKVEELIARIAQKARAAGIHLVLATQRPSVDVITGLIKANIPTRMAFQVSSGLNSRTILDQQGAEQLLGMGDMLYLPPGTGVPTRVHGAFVDDHEVHAVVNDWKERGEPNYIDEIKAGDPDQEILLPGEVPEGEESELDTLYDEALGFVTETRRVSISSVQRKFRIGYNRAARIVEQMELQGVVSTPGHNGAREVLAPPPIKD